MNKKAEEVLLLCQYCRRPFGAKQSASSITLDGGQRFTLCPRCIKRRAQLVAVQCAACGCFFPRSRKEVKQRQRWCTRAFCPACPSHPEAAYVTLTCSSCGRTFARRKKRETMAQKRGYQRRYCSFCHYRPQKGAQQAKPGVVSLHCDNCGREFQRLQGQERAARKSGFKRRLCPFCARRKVVSVICSRCGKQFPRWYQQVQRKQRLGYRRSVCPECFLSSRQQKGSSR